MHEHFIYLFIYLLLAMYWGQKSQQVHNKQTHDFSLSLSFSYKQTHDFSTSKPTHNWFQFPTTSSLLSSHLSFLSSHRLSFTFSSADFLYRFNIWCRRRRNDGGAAVRRFGEEVKNRWIEIWGRNEDLVPPSGRTSSGLWFWVRDWEFELSNYGWRFSGEWL